LLTTYQLRFHFIAYYTIKQVCNDMPHSIGHIEHRRRLRVLIPWKSFEDAMGFVEGEDGAVLMPHLFFGLSDRNLIGEGSGYGDKASLGEGLGVSVPSDGVIVTPSIQDAELYLWAAGLGDVSPNDLLTQPMDVDLSQLGVSPITDASLLPPNKHWPRVAELDGKDEP
jgi:hypothetical protein